MCLSLWNSIQLLLNLLYINYSFLFRVVIEASSYIQQNNGRWRHIQYIRDTF